MKNAKKRTTTTIGVMLIIAIIILLFYYYWSNRTEPLEDSSEKKLTEVEKLISKDLDNYYPETPKEVVKLYSGMTKVLYSDLKDDDVKALALKIRELYDDEFLKDNPEESYLTDLYTDIAKWKDDDRTITNYVIVKEDLDEEKEVDGVKYATKYVSFTIQENIKFAETRKIYLRQDENKKWKIFGWEYIPEDDSEK